MMVIKYYEIAAQSVLDNKPLEYGALYWCIDSGKVFFDSESQNSRVEMSNNSIFLETELERNNLIAPIPNKFYFIKESCKLYVFNENGWNCVNNVDSELSEESSNPVENKVVTSKLNKLDFVRKISNRGNSAYPTFKWLIDENDTDIISHNGFKFKKTSCISHGGTLEGKFIYIEGETINYLDALEICDDISVFENIIGFRFEEAGIEGYNYNDAGVTLFKLQKGLISEDNSSELPFDMYVLSITIGGCIFTYDTLHINHGTYIIIPESAFNSSLFGISVEGAGDNFSKRINSVSIDNTFCDHNIEVEGMPFRKVSNARISGIDALIGGSITLNFLEGIIEFNITEEMIYRDEYFYAVLLPDMLNNAIAIAFFDNDASTINMPFAHNESLFAGHGIYFINEKQTLTTAKLTLADGHYFVDCDVTSQSSGSGLPNVTTDDDGKTMEVVGGKWEPVEHVKVPNVTAYDDGKTMEVVDGKWSAVEHVKVPNVTTDDDGKTMEVVGGKWEPVEHVKVPNVTVSDNDKFMRVVNGKWEAVTIPNAEEIEF